ncbi:hypothetical protein [Streptomyces sp. NPDC005525]|uniref:hypothetical protein n=1 Tax=Streptomyces sp. NPDC005525 TaxID=3364720 RepID=UPI0036CF6374
MSVWSEFQHSMPWTAARPKRRGRLLAALLAFLAAIPIVVTGNTPAAAHGTAPPMPPTSEFLRGSRDFYATVGGGFTKGTIRWDYSALNSGMGPGRIGTLTISGTVKSTRANSCANARVHDNQWELTQFGTPGDPDNPFDPGTFEFRWVQSQENDFLIKPVCGLNQSRDFSQTWSTDLWMKGQGPWWNVWMGVQVDPGAFSGWK